MGSRYRYSDDAANAASAAIAASLQALTKQLKSQYDRGVHYFVGDSLSALDIYWTAFANLLDPLPEHQFQIGEARRHLFTNNDPVVKAALDPLLLEHRSRILQGHFRDPMEL
jgi:glutathione S-transferase